VKAPANKFRWSVLKMRHGLTFLATFKIDHQSHENIGRHIDPGAAHHLGGRLYRSVAGFGSAYGAAGELTSAVGARVGDTGANMLSVDQLLRLISVPAVLLAFHIAAQVSGG
jgi:hypothetical protein